MKYDSIRAEIKLLAQDQIEVKPQRKTVNFTGTRNVGSDDAQYIVLKNSYELMHLYMAYQVLKGKEIIYPTKKEYSQSKIDKLVKQHTFVESKVA